MKIPILSCGLVVYTVCLMVSCKKSADTAAPDPMSADRAVIRSMSFGTANLKKVDGGYIVEGDIFLSHEDIKTGGDKINVPAEEQWRTFNLVSLPAAPQIRTISIRLASNLNTAFWNTVLQNAADRFNAVGLRLRFSKVATTAAANITVSAVAGTGAQAGFPSGGNPFGSILMGTDIANCGTNTAVSVLAHEIGHCIGFRHTDWFAVVPCSGVPEGAGSVGAVLIPGTPSTVVPGSWMLSCYVCGADRPFVASDITALRALYN